MRRTLLLFALLIALAGCSRVEPFAARTRTPSPQPGTTPTGSPLPSPTATLSPDPTATQEPGPTGEPGSNWVINGHFTLGLQGSPGSPEYRQGTFAGWNQVNGYWYNPPLTGLHGAIPCSDSFGSEAVGDAGKTYYLQMDRDNIGNDLWPPPPSEDWAYQVITPPVIQTGPLYLAWEEAHHITNGEIVLTLYGRNPSEGFDSEWEVIYRKDGVSSPNGTGKCKVAPPAKIQAVLDTPLFEEYMLEIYGKMNSERDGVLWGDFYLSDKPR